MSTEVVLVIKYRTDGARRMARILDLGVVVEVRENGADRVPSFSNTTKALRWLAEHSYEPVDHVWLDQPGGIYRRRKSTFRLNESKRCAIEVGPRRNTHTKGGL